MFRSRFRLPICLCACLACFPAIFNPGLLMAQDSDPSATDEAPLAGHSSHGEAFNEGPRQAAYLMQGMSRVTFPATTENQLAQQYINQGVAQLHGFWYYEAERSFRQAAVLDPDCAVSYWGMAMANTGNMERARGFIQKAVERLDGVTPREKLFIESYATYCREKDSEEKKISKKDRAQRLTRDLETIVEENPDDIEAKAFLALQLWQNSRADLPIVSHVAIDAVLQDIFDVNPLHPSHHYRIHLWDQHKPKRALASAAQCGPSSPGIAHMWHMPGHIYDKLHRYNDAAWQQEASARVDHHHMMRDRVMPDQIHNFAHNNEWLVRSLVKVGRVEEALALAKNMLELPRHPKYNTLDRGSARYGRERLWLVLTNYRLWPELIDLSESMYLEPTDKFKFQVERLKYLGIAFALEGQRDQAKAVLVELENNLTAQREKLATCDAELNAANEKDEDVAASPADDIEEPGLQEPQAEPAISGAENSDVANEAEQEKVKEQEKERKERIAQLEKRQKETKDEIKQTEKSIRSIEVALLADEERWAEAVAGWEDADISDNLLKAEWLFAADQKEEALKVVASEVDKSPGQLLPVAVQAFLQFQEGGAEGAKDAFEIVRSLAEAADLETPLLARLSPLAAELSYGSDWRLPKQPADDLGDRPELDSLGPFRWQPYQASDFTVQTATGETVHLKQFSSQPTLVIFYLGFGCLHCVEQLQAFSPRVEEFTQQGINVIAISSESVESLNKGLAHYDEPLQIPLHADPELRAFQEYRCFDDFEQQPLHGTFLIDPAGRVLWQDISYEPFMDVDFALAESQRLLKLADGQSAR